MARPLFVKPQNSSEWKSSNAQYVKENSFWEKGLLWVKVNGIWEHDHEFTEYVQIQTPTCIKQDIYAYQCICKLDGSMSQNYTGSVDPKAHEGNAVYWKTDYYDFDRHAKKYNCSACKAYEPLWDELENHELSISSGTNVNDSEEDQKKYHWTLKYCYVCEHMVDISNRTPHTFDITYNDYLDLTHLTTRECTGCHFEYTEEEAHSFVVNPNQAYTGRDTNYHWKICEQCKGIGNTLERHNDSGLVPDPGNNASGHCAFCTTCGYLITPTQDHYGNYQETVDGISHYKNCSVCGYAIVPSESHTADTSYWETNGSKHWRKCSVCRFDMESTEGTHSGSYKETADGTSHYKKCATCDYTMVSTTKHTEKSNWSTDSVNHWKDCSVCYFKMDNTQGAHYGDYKETSDGISHYKNCSVCGYAIVSSEAHTTDTSYWEKDTSSHWRKCSVCRFNLEYTKANHQGSWDYNSDNHWKNCSTCGQEMETVGAHYSDWEITDTQHSKYCDACNYTMVSPTNHSYSGWGTNSSNHWRKCSVCDPNGYSYIQYDTHTKPATWNDYDNSKHYKYCTDGCGYIIESGTHVKSGSWSTDNGAHWKKCTSNCGQTYDYGTHSGSWTSVDDNYHHKLCSTCNYTINGNTSHDAVGGWITTDDTWHWKVCSTCNGQLYYNRHVEVNGGTESVHKKCDTCNRVMKDGSYHSYNASVTTAATCTTNGVKKLSCACGYYYTESIAAFGHDWNNPTYSGNGTSSYSATRTCKNDSSHKETAVANITSTVFIYPTCKTKGTTVYTANFTESWAADKSVQLQDIPINSNNHEGSSEYGGTAASHTQYSCCKAVISSSHTYDQNSGVKYSDATCLRTQKNYKSCICGYNPQSTSYLVSVGSINSNNHEGSSTWGGTSSVHTKYSCCGATISSAHSYDQNSGLMYSEATCTDYQKNYKSCECGYNPKSTSYLVSVGSKNPNNHTALISASAVAPTCTTAGNIAYSRCQGCNKYYNSNGTEISSSSITLAALGHSYSGKVTTTATCSSTGIKTYTCANDSSHTYTETIAKDPNNHSNRYNVSYVAPTCTESGHSSYYYCSGCSKYYDINYNQTTWSNLVIAATGHSTPSTWNQGDSSNHYKYCSNGCGAIVDSGAHSGQYDYNDSNHWKNCSACGRTLVSSTGHTLGAWQNDSSTHWKVCSVCSGTVNYSSHVDIDGWKTDSVDHWKVCKDCGYRTGSYIAHSGSYDYNGSYHWKNCSTCGYTMESSESHYGDWQRNSISHWKNCSVCGYSIVSSESHTNVDDWITDSVDHWKVCKDCGYLTTGYIAHSGSWSYNGSYHWKDCSTCGYSIENYEQHSYSWSSNDSQHWQTCKCGSSTSSSGHDYGSWQTSSNYHWRNCSTCGSTYLNYGTHSNPGYWNASNGTYHYKNCTDCNYNIESGYHSGSWNYDVDWHEKNCSACGYSMVSRTGHSMTVTSDDNYEYYTCSSGCGYSNSFDHSPSYSGWNNTLGGSYHSQICSSCGHEWIHQAGKGTYCAKCDKG